MEKSDEGNASIISSVTILFMILAVFSAAAATTYTVTNGNSLQDAINKAGNSDLIIVESGIYGNVDVNKPLTIQGKDIGFGQPVIDANNNSFGINISADGVSVDGFKVINASIAGIYVTSDNNNILNNVVTSNEKGIYLAPSSNNRIYRNVMYDNQIANALDTNNFANNWNNSTFGNYYDDVNVLDWNGDGFNDSNYKIYDGSGTITAFDHHRLVVASKASSPISVSASGTASFTVHTLITNHADIDVENIALYYKLGNGNWTIYSNSTDGIFTFSTSSSGEYSFYTVATDRGGIIETVPDNNDSTTSVTISSVNGGSSSSSGGGGGGGGNSGESFENILMSETQREYVNKGSNVIYRFGLDGNIVRYIKFTGEKSSGQISAKVEILKGVSDMVDLTPQDIVYKHLNIWVGNLGWASPNNIADPTVEFKVEKSWISQNRIDISTIRLNRYNDGNWDSLETQRTDQDSDNYYFIAKAPGFSPFAVTGKETQSLPEATYTGEHTAEVEDRENQKNDEDTQGSPGFGLVAGLMVLAIAMLRKR